MNLKREEIKDNRMPTQKYAQENRWDLVKVFTEFPINTHQKEKANAHKLAYRCN
ncbi:hypothetical protein [Legionella cardiaca]|uniref:Uncharacterized protein n=1 Tax=Legionella cardiaca TaxID=1071983 RepID=A0ABY8ATN3_9GAMM|nr:hypothetical protein [Legionella cardiaca]WED43843.1 hypothetical protein PXX05_03415 [Legionella cardiaca]